MIMIQTSLSPNAQKDDILLALSLLIRPFVWRRKSAVDALEKKLGGIVRQEHVVAVDSGRTALFTLLKALNIGKGDEVLLQAYTCVAVPAPVLWCDATPVYVDCTDNFTLDIADLERKITREAKAIIVQHTFGAAADMSAIRDIAKKHNLFVIEDCAHAFGGSLDDAPLGSLSDAAFFSFGRDKCVSSVFGGAITTNSGELNGKVRALVASYPQPSFLWTLRQLLHPIILGIAKSTYNILGTGRLFLGVARRLRIISRAVERRELRGETPSFARHRFSGALAVLALRQIEKLSQFTRHRRGCAAAYEEKLKNTRSLQLPRRTDGHAFLRYTILTDNPKHFIAKARQHGIELGDWYQSVIAPTGVVYEKVGYTAGSCPNAEHIATRSLNLPTHIGITQEKIDAIVRYVFL